MEEGEFPGWGVMLICVLAALIPSTVVESFVKPELFFLGPLVGSVCCGAAISATCGMTVQRACIAAALFFAVQIVIGLTLGMLAA